MLTIKCREVPAPVAPVVPTPMYSDAILLCMSVAEEDPKTETFYVIVKVNTTFICSVTKIFEFGCSNIVMRLYSIITENSLSWSGTIQWSHLFYLSSYCGY